jgi:two-component sensor histidine kinase
VRVRTEDDAIAISVRDEGVGLPHGFDPVASKRLGARLVNALSKQLGGELARLPVPTGTNFTLHIPLRSATTQ